MENKQHTTDEAEKDLTINVLKHYLGRDPGPSDFEKCISYYILGDTPSYKFVYDEVSLGIIEVISYEQCFFYPFENSLSEFRQKFQ